MKIGQEMIMLKISVEFPLNWTISMFFTASAPIHATS